MAFVDVEMIPVTSSQIESVGFDPETGKGYVRFLARGRGTTSLYEYEGCTQEEATAIITAPSVGIAFGQIWKGTKIYRKIS